MITVHHLENSRSQRVLWLLEELELPYEIVRYARDPKTLLAPESLKRVHPLGKSPVVVDDGAVLAETAAAMEALLDAHGDGRLRPAAGTADAQRHRFWMHYAEGSAMPWLLLKLVFLELPGKAPWLAKPLVHGVAAGVQQKLVDPQLKTHLDYWEHELKGREWLVGESLTAADLMMSFPIEAAASRAFARGERPVLEGYLARLHARPAYQRALERGGPYAYA